MSVGAGSRRRSSHKRHGKIGQLDASAKRARANARYVICDHESAIHVGIDLRKTATSVERHRSDLGYALSDSEALKRGTSIQHFTAYLSNTGKRNRLYSRTIFKRASAYLHDTLIEIDLGQSGAVAECRVSKLCCVGDSYACQRCGQVKLIVLIAATPVVLLCRNAAGV